MENQYTYYTPEQDDRGEQSPREPKKRGKLPKFLLFLCGALVLGAVAGAAFEVTGHVVGRVIGTEDKTGNEVKKAEALETADIKTEADGTISTNITEIAQNAMPSVVSITNLSIQEVQSFFGGVSQQELTSAGSGIIIDQTDTELLVLTNNHVVEGSKTLTVSFIDEESVEANIKGADAERDLAVVAIDLKSIKDSTMKQIKVAALGDSTSLQVGEPAIAIGNALGYGQSVTTGIISATDRTMEGIEGGLIQTDAAINPGNSGGALLNAKGEVIGINTAKIAVNEVEGIGYAIPVSDAGETITTLMNRETRAKVPENEQGMLGITGLDVNGDSAQMYNMPSGVFISEVAKGSGAAKAGISKGSIITKFDGITIGDMAGLKEQLQYYRAGETVEVTIQVPSSDGEYTEEKVEVTLGRNS